jgi:hypothetical protein
MGCVLAGRLRDRGMTLPCDDTGADYNRAERSKRGAADAPGGRGMRYQQKGIVS